MSHDSGHDNSYEPKHIVKEAQKYPFWTSKYFWFALAVVILGALVVTFV